MDETFDVVIAGGAVTGSSTAYHLAALHGMGARVLVLDKDMTYSKAASALSASSIRQQFSSAVNIRVSMYGIDFLRKAREILAVDGDTPDIAVREKGYLYLATQAGAKILAENHVLQEQEGADILLMDVAELKRRFPMVETDDLAAASWGRTGEGWFDGYSLMQAFRRKARSLGVTYRQATVTGLVKAGDRITHVELSDGSRIACGAFLDAGGASGARAMARLAGFDIPVEARKRSVFSFTAREAMPDLPLTIDISGVWLRPEGEGFIAGCAPPEEQDPDAPDDFDVAWDQFEEIIWPALATRFKLFEELRPGRAWAGHYDLNLFDHNAIVGRMPGYANAFIAAGFSGHGLQQSPAVGRGLAELITQGRYTTLDLSDFAFERIAAGRKILEKNVI